VKTAEFNDLCYREYEQDKGDVVRLHLTQESYAELLTEVLGGDGLEVAAGGTPLPDGVYGARLDAMTNPATRTVTKVIPARPFVPDTAEVTGPAGKGRTVELAR
jgi:hypothetical protein